MIRDIASALSRAAQRATTAKASDLPSGHVRQDEIGALVESFGKMLVTIEQQADEINQFPRRLDQLARPTATPSPACPTERSSSIASPLP